MNSSIVKSHQSRIEHFLIEVLALKAVTDVTNPSGNQICFVVSCDLSHFWPATEQMKIEIFEK